MAGIPMPNERTLPRGPLRDLTLAVHDLYRAAGRPPVRDIAQRIAETPTLRGTASHESVRADSSGRLTRWEVLESVGHQLALMAHPPRDPKTVVVTLVRINRATESAGAL